MPDLPSLECTAWWTQLKKWDILESEAELPVWILTKGTAFEKALCT
jgi:hypothetical protein